MINNQESYYTDVDKMHVATDCIVFGFHQDELKLLIFNRRVQPHKGGWSLIGSFVKLNEDVDHAAKRVLRDITGLDNVFFEQSRTYGNAERDMGARCVSVAQFALIRIDEYDEELTEMRGAFWYRLEELPELVLDHYQMVIDALDILRRKAKHQPIGFELLPEKFTIPQLQSLYEAIFQRKLDPGNFRKKILSFKILNRLNEKDRSSSKRGAFYYTFDHDTYEKLLKSGYNFDFL
ncbi:NUDIX family hydrolase [Galbibacter marinus]|uniref:NUDIX family hydrolase n=1 Tax=Galbibacter marinus TaxID=555500 RepID=K2QJM6_9FLAO|nr:NUDIX domain-containing protein [Galbibacter marinus]EKF54907.1 NUDIX family hydrolase [Galbibacter marinus]